MSNAFNKLFKPPKTTAEWAATYCSRHGQPLPCFRCREYDEFTRESARVHRQNYELSIARAAAQAWGEVLQSAGVAREAKCVHGHMYYEHYCDVCRLAPVDPDYDPDIYRTEIDKAMKQARKSLTGSAAKQPRFEDIEKDDAEKKPLTEGNKDHQDLMQIIDIEVWKAAKKYGEGMNEQLAYTITENQVGKYLTARIEEQTVETNDRDGNVFRIPRNVSIDDKPQDDEGNETESPAEVAASMLEKVYEEIFAAEQVEKLRKLVATWYGDKRRVAEAMLQLGFTVRSVPGLSKSSVARIRKVVEAAFKAFITQDLKNNSK
jgi:hypothetical protein